MGGPLFLIMSMSLTALLAMAASGPKGRGDQGLLNPVPGACRAMTHGNGPLVDSMRGPGILQNARAASF